MSEQQCWSGHTMCNVSSALCSGCHAFCFFLLAFLSHTFLISSRIALSLYFLWIFHPTESLTHFRLSFSPTSKSKAARFIPLSLPHPSLPPSLRVHSLPLHVQGRWCSTLLSAAAICSNWGWGYEHASLCVCWLFTNGLAGQNTACIKSGSRQQDGNWMDDRLTARNRWLSGWLKPPCLLHWHIWASDSPTIGVWYGDK